jgi:2-methoxy-6-polyprenyl-1,4-benzoquinol methylase
MSRIALNKTLRVKASLPAVQVHALRHASSLTSSSSTTPLGSTSSAPRSEIPDASTNTRKSRTTHFGFREIPEEDKETMGMSIFSEWNVG